MEKSFKFDQLKTAGRNVILKLKHRWLTTDWWNSLMIDESKKIEKILLKNIISPLKRVVETLMAEKVSVAFWKKTPSK